MLRVRRAPPADPPADWADAVHRLWRRAAEAEDVTDLATELYDLLLAWPGVLVVAGTRYDERDRPRYTRSGTGAPERPKVHAGSGRRVPERRPARAFQLVRHDVADLAEDAWPELPLLRDAAARTALECRFALPGDDWGTLTLGLASRSAATDGLRRALRQIAEIVAACARRLAADRADELRSARDAILAEASLQMGASLDITETLRHVSRIAVPAVAEGCLIHLRTDGELSCVAVAHVDARRRSALPAPGPVDPALGRVLAAAGRRTGTSRLEGPVLATAPFDALGGGALAAVTVTPLRARGRALGTVTFLYGTAAGAMPDIAFLDDLGHRAALAIDNASLYEQRRRHVISLQEHLLPPSLPDVPGVALGACYRVADPGLEVGGDFYDAVPGPAGGTSLMVGDVCGRGAQAAAMTGLARHTLRTLLEDGAPAEAALSRLNRSLINAAASRFMTAVVASVTPDGDGLAVRHVNAGHPAPVVLRADGTVEFWHDPGVLLGVLDDVTYEPAARRLGPGDTLVLYTDGLTEARATGGGFFEAVLPERLAALAGLDAATLAARLVEDAVAFRGEGSDDIAVLVAQPAGGRG
ncbi:PP2C family protein-serine/threonine phosphatase [Actinomadura flavalba]|uniref:PP2C family protein-serine/threonine phosphatase n=1 Tax=Actinomadura flavalba TaxID=1120938 RepID=UPI00036203C5|nr:GAF domain-containing SpoIIE family protein phosphatase [Actinomadura flavalba]